MSALADATCYEEMISMNTRRNCERLSAIFIAAAMLILLLSGCGGGGKKTLSVAGVVSDVEGNLVPDATVTITGSTSRATTAFNGAYRLEVNESGWQMMTATATIGGVIWRGRQAVQVFGDGPTMNVNIIVGQVDKLGAISGVVRDASNARVEDARVFVSTPYGSAFDLTEPDGSYSIGDLPASVRVGGVDQSISYTMTASKLGFRNQTRDQNDAGDPITVTPGDTTSIDFVIEATVGSPVPIPTEFDITATAWTFPETVSRSPGAYDAIRAKVSPKLRKALLSKQVTRAAPPGSLIEIDVSWFDSWTTFLNTDLGGQPPDNLAGFAVYRREGSAPTSDTDRIYFDRQPLLTDFFDHSPELADGRMYFYRITALNTNFLDDFGNFVPESESDFSNAASTRPLNRLNETSPVDGIRVPIEDLTFSWLSISGAGSYMVFVYDRFPELQPTASSDIDEVVNPVAEIGPVSGTSVAGPGGLDLGATHYWVVIGANVTASTPEEFGAATAYSIGELRTFIPQ